MQLVLLILFIVAMLALAAAVQPGGALYQLTTLK